ncbi:MAG: TonB-dependent siderophore receptor [Xylophilus ampelinus]
MPSRQRRHLAHRPRPAATQRHALRPLALAASLALSSALHAQPSAGRAPDDGPPQRYDLPAGPLDATLTGIARRAGHILVVDPALVGGRTGAPVRGSLTPEQAFAQALAGSGLEIVPDGAAGYTVRQARPAPARPDAAAPARANALPAVTVTARNEEERAAGPVRGYLARRSATATKTDTPLLETPQSLSIVTADRMEAQGALTLKDAIGYTPGVGIAPYGADSRYDWITLRGFDAYSPGFYLDGLPLRNGSNFGIWKTENYGAERIEVLRGPASALYGQGNPGGVVNVVSKRPAAEPVRELQVQLGNHRRRQVAADFSGALNDDGTLLYRLTGVLRDAELPAGRMPDDYHYLAPSLTWKPDTGTSFTLLSQFSRTHAGAYTRTVPAYGSLVPTAAGGRLPPDLYLGDPAYNRFHHDQQMVGYEFEHRIDPVWSVRQNLRVARLSLDYRQLNPLGFQTRDATNPADPANFRWLARAPFASRERIASFAVDNQVRADMRVGDWSHRIVLGLDHQRTRVDQVSRSGGTAPDLDTAAPVYGTGGIALAAPYFDGISTLTQTGLYLQDQIKWRDRWAISLGGRYDDAKGKLRDRSSGADIAIDDRKFTGRAGASYLLPDGWAPYASYTQSFLPTNTVDPVSGKPFGAETARQYEAGVRYQPPGGKQTYSAAVFDLRRQNYVTYDAATFLPQQRGEISVRGIELEATAELLPRLNLVAAYNYTDRAIVTRSSNPAEIGRQATAVPRNRLSVWSDYRFAHGVRVGLGARYNGGTRGENEAAPAPVPAYTLYDALLGYDFGAWSAALNLRNLTNRNALTNCGATTCYYGAPRSVAATATYRF